MPFYRMSLESFEKLLEVRNSNLTPSVQIELSTNPVELKQELARLKTAIDGTTRFISEFNCVHADGSIIFSNDDPEIKEMYYSYIGLPMKQKYETQLLIKNAIVAQPYGPYADFLRTPDAPYANQGEIFPQSEISGLEPVPAKFFDDKSVQSVKASHEIADSFTPGFRL